MRTRRLLLVLCVVAAFHATQSKAGWFEPEPDRLLLYMDPPAAADCPTQDHGGWTKTSTMPAERIEWVVSPEQAREQCRGPGNGMCASIGWEFLRDGTFYGRVWSPNPPEFYSPTAVLHELCHTQGWTHGRHAPRR